MNERADEYIIGQPPTTGGLRLGAEQEQRLRQWPTDRIRPKSVALGVLSLLAEVDALRAERDAARADAALVREALAMAERRASHPGSCTGWLPDRVPEVWLPRCDCWLRDVRAALADPNPGAALVEAADGLMAAFVKHRTATHEVKPKHCKTCREGDAAIDQYRAARSAASSGEA